MEADGPFNNIKYSIFLSELRCTRKNTRPNCDPTVDPTVTQLWPNCDPTVTGTKGSRQMPRSLEFSKSAGNNWKTCAHEHPDTQRMAYIWSSERYEHIQERCSVISQYYWKMFNSTKQKSLGIATKLRRGVFWQKRFRETLWPKTSPEQPIQDRKPHTPTLLEVLFALRPNDPKILIIATPGAKLHTVSSQLALSWLSVGSTVGSQLAVGFLQ